MTKGERRGPDIRNLKWMVVLGGGHTSYLRLPAMSKISKASLARLVEGIRIYKLFPASKLVLSGGSPFSPVPNEFVSYPLFVLIGGL